MTEEANTQPLPYWRLSSFYLFYFALLGGIVPFWSLYLDFVGLTAGEIGSLMAILMGTRIIAPNVWGWLADRSGRRVAIIRSGSFLTVLIFSWAFWAKDFWSLALLMFGFTFFWNAVLPQFEVVTLQALGKHRNRYSRIRLWGSIGFIIAVVVMGYLFDYVSVGWLVPILWGLMILMWLSTLWISNPDIKPVKVHKGDFLRIVKQPAVITFFIVCVIVQLGHGPYYTFYSIYMTDFGYSKGEIGLLWALGVVAEVLVFLIMHRWLEWFGLRKMIIFGLVISAIRWILIGYFADLLPVVLIAQLMHAVTFGCLHAACITAVHHFFPEQMAGQGQALYSSIGFGLGGALGAYSSGWIWTHYGSAMSFITAGVVCLLGVLIAWRGLRFGVPDDAVRQ